MHIWATSENLGDSVLFRHFDLTMFCLSVFSLIANATFLQTEKIKHCLVIGQQSIDSCVNIVILTVVWIFGWL